jgi:hypothetical protein
MHAHSSNRGANRGCCCFLTDVLLWVIRNPLGRPFLPSFLFLGYQQQEQMYVGLGW